MPPIDVPPDIWNEIGLLGSPADIATLCCVSHNALCILRPLLYRNITVGDRARRLVRSLVFEASWSAQIDDEEWAQALTLLINLRHLEISHHVSIGWASLPFIRFKLQSFTSSAIVVGAWVGFLHLQHELQDICMHSDFLGQIPGPEVLPVLRRFSGRTEAVAKFAEVHPLQSMGFWAGPWWAIELKPHHTERFLRSTARLVTLRINSAALCKLFRDVPTMLATLQHLALDEDKAWGATQLRFGAKCYGCDGVPLSEADEFASVMRPKCTSRILDTLHFCGSDACQFIPSTPSAKSDSFKLAVFSSPHYFSLSKPHPATSHSRRLSKIQSTFNQHLTVPIGRLNPKCFAGRQPGRQQEMFANGVVPVSTCTTVAATVFGVHPYLVRQKLGARDPKIFGAADLTRARSRPLPASAGKEQFLGRSLLWHSKRCGGFLWLRSGQDVCGAAPTGSLGQRARLTRPLRSLLIWPKLSTTCIWVGGPRFDEELSAIVVSLERNPAPNLRPVPHDEIDLTIERAAPDEDLMMEGEMTPAEDTIVLNDTEMQLADPIVSFISAEAIERAWAELTPVAPTTREMGQGHRHDFLDDNHWAWTQRATSGERTESLWELGPAPGVSNQWSSAEWQHVLTIMEHSLSAGDLQDWREEQHRQAVYAARQEWARAQADRGLSGVAAHLRASQVARASRAREMEQRERWAEARERWADFIDLPALESGECST
ncbi:hypothetical protein B0H17DRAFT_1131959 [Mycena rosella]|uniref:Uncharacterized protein n=1 Tax=Mycena rosella TaxID=1033263 RepID=A0AAD7DM76_MYCRO|nr:hypothetical protein B0H17DRAFT_1131959 [Mycena rosella]